MDSVDYRSMAKSIRTSKRLGQSFLVDSGIAKSEAEYARDRNVVELGAGLGILTCELCSVAKSVVAVEYDSALFELLNHNLKAGNLKLIKGDFFKLDDKLFGNADIMVSNIPYNLSSKVLAWLGEKSMPAVLCLQKEFVRHMLAEAGTSSYSRLSVTAKLQFQIYLLTEVPAAKFYPKPKVDSAIIYMKPRKREIDRKTLETIGLLMMHKKKKIRNAMMDSAKALGIGKEDAAGIAKKLGDGSIRPFQMEPEAILAAAEKINSLVRSLK
jgi:16S rRNA (adenine1518-N6/adenine1519-N6)-dimethyltransferase